MSTLTGHFCPTRDKSLSKQQDKLLATVYDKKRYIIHYRKLQQCMRHGLHVTKIHRIAIRTIIMASRLHTYTK